MALFAGALASFAQMVNGVDPTKTDTTTLSWGALLVFLYSAIMLSLAGSFLSLIVIKMCSDLPLAAQQKILEEGSPLSNRSTFLSGSGPRSAFPFAFVSSVSSHKHKPLSTIAARGGKIDAYILANRSRLLEHFGMSRGFKVVDRMGSFVLLAACICTCAALTFWIFLSEPIVTAGVTMVCFGVTAIIVILAYGFATDGQGWS
jgi:hypothetical protein